MAFRGINPILSLTSGYVGATSLLVDTLVQRANWTVILTRGSNNDKTLVRFDTFVTDINENKSYAVNEFKVHEQ